MIAVDISSFFASGAGGIRTYYHAKAHWLPQAGVECHFVVPGEHRSTERFGGGWLHRIPGPALAAGYRAFGDLRELRATLRALAPSIIEVASHYVLPQLLALWGAAPTLVGFYHADIPSTYVSPQLARFPRLQRAAVAATWRWIRHQHARYATTFAGSHGIASRLAAHGVRSRWVGLGVDPDRFHPAPRDRALRLGYAGRWASDKEIDLVLAAAPAIERATGARIVIAGDGPRADIVRRHEQRGLVDVVGVLDREAMPAFLRSCDAVIVPGRYESFSLVAAEALASGTPVIAPDQGGAAELVERSGAGLRFAPGDPAALTAAVEDFYRLDASSTDELGAAGRRHVLAEHTWQRVFERVRAGYREARC